MLTNHFIARNKIPDNQLVYLMQKFIITVECYDEKNSEKALPGAACSAVRILNFRNKFESYYKAAISLHPQLRTYWMYSVGQEDVSKRILNDAWDIHDKGRKTVSIFRTIARIWNTSGVTVANATEIFFNTAIIDLKASVISFLNAERIHDGLRTKKYAEYLSLFLAKIDSFGIDERLSERLIGHPEHVSAVMSWLVWMNDGDQLCSPIFTLLEKKLAQNALRKDDEDRYVANLNHAIRIILKSCDLSLKINSQTKKIEAPDMMMVFYLMTYCFEMQDKLSGVVDREPKIIALQKKTLQDLMSDIVKLIGTFGKQLAYASNSLSIDTFCGELSAAQKLALEISTRYEKQKWESYRKQMSASLGAGIAALVDSRFYFLLQKPSINQEPMSGTPADNKEEYMRRTLIYFLDRVGSIYPDMVLNNCMRFWSLSEPSTPQPLVLAAQQLVHDNSIKQLLPIIVQNREQEGKTVQFLGRSASASSATLLAESEALLKEEQRKREESDKKREESEAKTKLITAIYDEDKESALDVLTRYPGLLKELWEEKATAKTRKRFMEQVDGLGLGMYLIEGERPKSYQGSVGGRRVEYGSGVEPASAVSEYRESPEAGSRSTGVLPVRLRDCL